MSAGQLLGVGGLVQCPIANNGDNHAKSSFRARLANGNVRKETDRPTAVWTQELTRPITPLFAQLYSA